VRALGYLMKPTTLTISLVDKVVKWSILILEIYYYDNTDTVEVDGSMLEGGGQVRIASGHNIIDNSTG
jgi:hypothetical protein